MPEAETLTALDATFLELEQADDSAHMHIGALMVFEPLGEGLAPDPSDVAAHLRPMLTAMPRYRQRLSEPRTGGLSWPRWLEDPNFDPATHVQRAALPNPGGEAELLDWAGDYFSQRLDRSRPLWDLVVLEGLSGGRWALASKTHHCMVDGVGSVDVTDLLLDEETVPAEGGESGNGAPAGESGNGAPAGEPRAVSGGPETGGVEGALRSAASGATDLAGAAVRLPLRAAGAGLGALRHPERAREAFEKSRAVAEVLVRDEMHAAPHTSLNEPIGAHRRLATLRVPMRELKEINAALGGTVNDAVLAISSGGLRDLLEARGEEPPAEGLRAMVPVNIRKAGEHLDLGNRVTSLFVHLPVAEADPLQRYRLQVSEAEGLKSGNQGTGSKSLIDLTAMAPPAIHSFLARSLFATRLFNVTITNVPGPRSSRYAFGSRMLEVWPLVPIAASHAIGVAVVSYDGDLFFCVNADRDTVPDLSVLSDGMADSLRYLREEASGLSGQAGG